MDDSFDFGAIAAANSLSDIYAMGGKPLFALNIVGFPTSRLPMEVLEEIIKGALYIANKANISIIGGHTIEDNEPKFGLAVTGVVNPERVITNSKAAAGDILILTKPIGTGIYSTALKQNLLSETQISELREVMIELNKNASEAMLEAGANACTDISGFGLVGHLLEMMRASKTTASIYLENIPLLDGVVEFAASGIIPGGTRNNVEHTLRNVHYSDDVSEIRRLILNDAQTSGGLLISISESKQELLLHTLQKRGIIKAKVIGKILPLEEYYIKVNN